MYFAVVKSSTIKSVTIMIIVCVLLAVSFSGARFAEVFCGYSTRLVPVYSVETDKKQVAISFDAPWCADKPAGLLETFIVYYVHSTFFLVGLLVVAFPEYV